MKNTNQLIRLFWLSSFALLASISSISAAPVVRQAAGGSPSLIQSAVDIFRVDLGGANNGVGGSFTTGRREINWDAVPDNFAAPNFLPPNFFNVNSPRGAVFNTIGNPAIPDTFLVSADSSNPTNTAVRFGNFNPTYPTIFQTFSAERLFVPRAANQMEIVFFVPGTNIPATVSGFGAVFTDVDDNNTSIIYYAADGSQIARINPVPDADHGLSFAGVSFNAGERVARVVIKNGDRDLSSTNTEQPFNGVDVVAMDDFIYGEPRASQYHPSDFDGDGTSDLSVFRPSTGQWFVLSSGSNTFSGVQFGLAGDVPVEGDFDGDSRSDLVVFRPSVGTWFIINSSNNQTRATQFGSNGDKPVPGDYDKDGKTDIAVWRPSSGTYFVLRSSNGAVQISQWGTNGDIPIGAALVP